MYKKKKKKKKSQSIYTSFCLSTRPRNRGDDQDRDRGLRAAPEQLPLPATLPARPAVRPALPVPEPHRRRVQPPVPLAPAHALLAQRQRGGVPAEGLPVPLRDRPQARSDCRPRLHGPAAGRTGESLLVLGVRLCWGLGCVGG